MPQVSISADSRFAELGSRIRAPVAGAPPPFARKSAACADPGGEFRVNAFEDRWVFHRIGARRAGVKRARMEPSRRRFVKHLRRSERNGCGRLRAGGRRAIFTGADTRGSSAGARRSIIPNVSGSYKVGASVSLVRAKPLFQIIFGFHID
ncbi:hypothetical protein [Burkholderia sp. MSMB1589WGS]|uniref:hypothetical protein n=1 Tax=Burkholderia sp. MSMB1589WGS TaxID=1636425 RepID=UPI000A66B0DD|nr:hypothetical protein [Burkholderia sp. MSMB1589WGS]